MLYAVITVLAAIAVLCAAPLLRRNTRLDEVDRFHTARTLTTEWASEPQAHVRVPAQGTVADD